MKRPKMSHFESVEDAVNYGVSELLDTLQDDYQRMAYDKYERVHIGRATAKKCATALAISGNVNL